MTYVTLLTAAGHRVTIDPKKSKFTFRSLLEGLVAESRLEEKQIPYQKVRAKRRCKGDCGSVDIANSLAKQLERLKSPGFKKLDNEILAVGNAPTPLSHRPKHFRWLAGDLRLRRTNEHLIVYTFSQANKGTPRVAILTACFWGGPRPRRSHTVLKKQNELEKRTTRIASDEDIGKGRKWTEWFAGYSGETADELFSYPPQGQWQALVQGFEEAIQRKASRHGARSLTRVERTVLAVQALEREVNDGGYDQFFRNQSRRFAPVVVAALKRIGCATAARITEKALNELGLPSLSSKAFSVAMAMPNDLRDERLQKCDESFYRLKAGFSRRLYDFIKRNRKGMKF